MVGVVSSVWGVGAIALGVAVLALLAVLLVEWRIMAARPGKASSAREVVPFGGRDVYAAAPGDTGTGETRSASAA